MTIRELIDRLKSFDPETELFVKGYEGGWDKAETVFDAELILDAYEEWYYGRHEMVDCSAGDDILKNSKDKKIVKGILIY